VAFGLSAAVVTAIASEFFRGARVISKQSGKNLLVSAWTLTRRNTRRYGGYIVHIGVVLTFVGLAGAAFNQTVEKELPLHGKMQLGSYTFECTGFTQDSNDNYQTEYAMLDVWKDGKVQFQMAPEMRIYLASQQPQTMVAIHSTIGWDVYTVYEGTNPDTGQPIVKAFLNPLVSWLWAGLVVMVIGTLVALVPSVKLDAGSIATEATVSESHGSSPKTGADGGF
jgi:cytochrome c-type biogenesis protein CcmF